MRISERIYKYLDARDMSQIDFSKKTGISQSTISDWRRKGTNPSADKIMVICEVLDISPYELLSGIDNEQESRFAEENHVVIDKTSKEYQLIKSYRDLDSDARNRLEGYVKALSEM